MQNLELEEILYSQDIEKLEKTITENRDAIDINLSELVEEYLERKIDINLNFIELLIKNGLEVDAVNSDGDTALMFAAMSGGILLTELLLKNGANPNLKINDISLLFYIISLKEGIVENQLNLLPDMFKNKFQIAQLLIDFGAKIDNINVTIDPLSHCCLMGELESAKFLVRNGFRVGANSAEAFLLLLMGNTKSIFQSFGMSNISLEQEILLFQNIDNYRFELAKLLLNNGIDINEILEGQSFLQTSIDLYKVRTKEINDIYDSELNIIEKEIAIKRKKSFKSNIEIIKFLIENGADVNIINDVGGTPLHSAIKQGNIQLVQLLVENGANINYKIHGMISYYNIAKRASFSDIEDYLELQGACTEEDHISKEFIDKIRLDIDYALTDARNYIHENEFENSKPKIVELLPKIFNSRLSKVLESKSTKELEQLIESEYDISNIDLFLLFKDDYPIDFIKLVIQNSKNDKNQQDAEGNTPLMYASIKNDFELLEALLISGADKNIKNNEGKRAKDFTQDSKIRNLLLTYNKEQKKFKIHNPQLLSKNLAMFSNIEDLRFTNHPWYDGMKYDQFHNNLKEGWSTIENELKKLSPELHENINKFFFEDLNNQNTAQFCGELVNIGWSSKSLQEFLKEDSKNKPHDLESFKRSIELFKSSIVIKENDSNLKLLKKFTKIRKDNKLSIKLNLYELKDDKVTFDKVFTNVYNIQKALEIILKDIQEIDKNAEVKIKVKDSEDFVEILIIHLNSNCKSSAENLSNTINKTGNFTTIYETLKSVCDWRVETICGDGGRYLISYLFPEEDKNKPHCIQIEHTIEGFTHILRMYK